jgi:hypothetical protein
MTARRASSLGSPAALLRVRRTFARLSLVASCASCASCLGDPVHDDAVAALGAEIPSVPAGELHRAGQPCVECHQSGGPASSAFSVAGTVFNGPTDGLGLENVQVRMVDAAGSQRVVSTNCVGNFFIRQSDWDPAFPIKVGIGLGDVEQVMKGIIGRHGGCASCHQAPAGQASPGPVFLNAADSTETPPSCNGVSPISSWVHGP